MDDNKNNQNNPLDGMDFFGLGDIDGFKIDSDETVIFGDDSFFEEAEITFEEPKTSAPKSFSLGPINTSDEEPKKKKFVVTFDDSEDIVPPVETESKNPRSRGGVYFSNGVPANDTVEQETPKRRTSSSKQAKPKSPEKPKPAKKVNTKSKNKKKKKPVSQGSFALRFISTVLAISLFLSFLGISCINDVLAITRSDDSVVVTIPNDCTADDIIDILSENKLIHQKWFCKLFFNLKNKVFNDDPNEMVFLSGVYYVKKNLGFEAYLMEFQEVQETEKTVNVFFQEGWTTYQMFDKLENFEICKKEELIAALKGADYDFDFIKNIPDSSNRVFKLEGYLFPDTYEFYEKCDANTIIRKMLANFESKWNNDYAKRAEELGLSMDEVMTIASIIQREAGSKDQMPLVSSVIHNRLNHSISYPTLGCDATANYIEKYVKPNVTSVQAQAYLAYYDTSSIKGLPEGPICNPGIDAIEAALYPEETNYYYFCHDNSGQIYLAATNAEHDKNLLEVLRKNNG